MLLRPKHICCVDCGEPFTADNVHSIEGWSETQISGLCEDCFDALFEEMEERCNSEELEEQEDPQDGIQVMSFAEFSRYYH